MRGSSRGGKWLLNNQLQSLDKTFTEHSTNLVRSSWIIKCIALKSRSVRIQTITFQPILGKYLHYSHLQQLAVRPRPQITLPEYTTECWTGSSPIWRVSLPGHATSPCATILLLDDGWTAFQFGLVDSRTWLAMIDRNHIFPLLLCCTYTRFPDPWHATAPSLFPRAVGRELL